MANPTYFPWSPGAHIVWRRSLWLLLSIVLVAADRITKLLIVDHFFLGERHNVIPGFFDLVLTYNTGAAFSFLANAGGWQPLFFIAVSVIAVLLLTWLMLRSAQPTFCLSAALIIGGAIGNMWDRIEYGRVVDFLLFYLRNWYYPAFNVADCAIVVGALLLIVDGIRQRKHLSAEDAQ